MTTRLDVKQRAAYSLGDIKFAGPISEARNYPTYGMIWFVGPPPIEPASLKGAYAVLEGYEYRIHSYDPNNERVLVTPSFASVAATGAYVTVFKDFSQINYNNAFDTAYYRLSNRVLEEVEATAAVSTVPRYSIDSTWKYVNRVELERSGEAYPMELDPMFWYIRNGDVQLKPNAPVSSYDTIIFRGQRHPQVPGDEMGTIFSNGIFQDCLGYRMVEHLGMQRLKAVTQTQDTSGTAIATTFGTVITLGTTMQVTTSSQQGTTQGTLAILEHVTGREERNQEYQSTWEQASTQGYADSSELTDTFSNTSNIQQNKLTEENWIAFVEAAVAAADALEVYLFERPKPNSRRLR